MDKLLIICGPTATGKTSLAIKLASEFNGEIISADSRQVYRGMDIGTGKDVGNEKIKNQNDKIHIKNKNFTVGFREKGGLPVWLVDIVKPDYQFNVGEYVELARVVIEDIHNRGKLPILVGGTGLYIKGLIHPFETAHIPPNAKLREKLYSVSPQELGELLREEDATKWNSMNESDRLNPRRLIRAIEVSSFMTENLNTVQYLSPIQARWNMLHVGLSSDIRNLYPIIDKRVEARVEQGVVHEIQDLLSHGYTWDLPSMNTYGYKEWKEYFSGVKSKEDVIQQWKYDGHEYARKQLTWFKKQTGITWFDCIDPQMVPDVCLYVKKWYTNGEF